MNLLPGIITFLHDLFTAVWIGGLFFLVIILLPTMKKKQKTEPKLNTISIQLQKRLRIFVIISILGLWITGMMLAKSNQAGGFLKFGTTYQILLSIKHLLILGMIGLAVWRSLILMQFEKVDAQNLSKKMQIMKRSVPPLLINFVLGIGVLFLTGLLAFTPV